MALELDSLEAQLDCSLVWVAAWQPPETPGSPTLEAAISPAGLLALLVEGQVVEEAPNGLSALGGGVAAGRATGALEKEALQEEDLIHLILFLWPQRHHRQL